MKAGFIAGVPNKLAAEFLYTLSEDGQSKSSTFC